MITFERVVFSSHPIWVNLFKTHIFCRTPIFVGDDSNPGFKWFQVTLALSAGRVWHPTTISKHNCGSFDSGSFFSDAKKAVILQSPEIWTRLGKALIFIQYIFGRHEENLGFEVWKHHQSYFFPRFEMLIESGKHISFAKEPAWLIRFFFGGVVRLTAHDKTRLGSLKTLQGCFSTHGELVRAPSSNHWVESVSKY